MRGDKSFAYDLIVRYGPVSSRVALLLRSAEGKPPSTRFVFKTLHHLLPSARDEGAYFQAVRGLKTAHPGQSDRYPVTGLLAVAHKT